MTYCFVQCGAWFETHQNAHEVICIIHTSEISAFLWGEIHSMIEDIDRQFSFRKRSSTILWEDTLLLLAQVLSDYTDFARNEQAALKSRCNLPWGRLAVWGSNLFFPHQRTKQTLIATLVPFQTIEVEDQQTKKEIDSLHQNLFDTRSI